MYGESGPEEPPDRMDFVFIHPRMTNVTRQCFPFLCRTQTFKQNVSKADPTDMRHKTGCGITSVCGSAAGVALRLRFTMRFSPPPLHFSRSPTADRSQIIRIRGQGAEFANQ